MMKMTVHDVVDVIPVRNGGMSARRPVRVIDHVSTASMIGRACRWIGRVHANEVRLDLTLLDVIHPSTIDVVPMIFVLDRRVAATFAMRVLLSLRHLVIAHLSPA
jgi:hypothetical protein